MQIPSIPLKSTIASLYAVVTVSCLFPCAATASPIAQSADFSYALTTQNDPARPGEKMPMSITLTNLTAVTKSAQITFVVPNHVTADSYNSGDTYTFATANITAGASQTLQVAPIIKSGASSPADGTMIDFQMRDLSRAITFSRSIEVQSARAEELKLSTSTGSVAPGEDFIYTLAYHNGRPSPIAGAKMRLPIPAGATFVSADSGGTSSGGVVNWVLGTLDPGEVGQAQVRFTAPAAIGTALLLDATLLDSTDQILAQSSDVKTMASTPALSYSMTTQNDTAKPGEQVPLAVTVTNVSATSQVVDLTFNMPNYAASNSYDAGDTYFFPRMTLAAGKSQTALISPVITSGANSPPDGSVLNFVTRDRARGASISRSIVVQSSPTAELKLSSSGGTVVPGGNFIYTLAYHNWSPIAIAGAKLSLPVPTGATFVSADSGGTLNNGVVDWALGNLAVKKTGHVEVTFTAPLSQAAHLLLDARLRNAADNLLAQASDVKTLAALPTFTYSLATQGDPVGPGEKFPLAVTVTNLTNSSQTTDLTMEMPNYGFYSTYTAGDTYYFPRLTVAAGASQTVTVAPTITSGANSPQDGTILNFAVRDEDRGACVSRSVVTQSMLTADLKLSTIGGTVAPGGTFDYTLAYHNGNVSTLTGAKLSLPVPAGATFVAADGGGVLNNGVVQWTVGDLPALKSGQVKVTFAAPAVLGSHMLLDAKFRNGANEIVAQASDVKSMASFPVFSYAFSTQVDTAKSGETVPLAVTVTNLTNSAQSTELTLEMPNYVAYSTYTAGETYYFTQVSNLPAGASRIVNVSPTITSGANSPPDGTILNFIVRDVDRGASISRNIVAQSPPKAELKLSTESGTVPSSGSFSYTLTYRNSGTAEIAGTKLVLPVPAGATFVTADADGALVDGMVQWSLGATSPGSIGKVKVDFTAPATGKSALLLDAKLMNGANELLAHASDVKAIYDFPTFSYEIIPPTGLTGAGGTAAYTVNVTNLTNAAQIANLSVVVPRHTNASGVYVAGQNYNLSGLNVASLASASRSINITVDSGANTPSDGSLINLIVWDEARGVSLSHTMAVNRSIYTYGTIIRTLALSGDLNFGKIYVGKSATRTLTMKNTGISPLTVSKVTFPAGYSGSYAGTIPAGGSANVAVTFRPTGGKAYNGNLTVTSDKTDGANQLPLTGTGASRYIKLGGNLNFGKVTVSSKKTLTLTITNVGNEPLTVTKLVLPTGYKGSFSGVINPGKSQKIPVTFQPTKRKNYAGTLTVISNKNQGVDRVSLAGQGK